MNAILLLFVVNWHFDWRHPSNIVYIFAFVCESIMRMYAVWPQMSKKVNRQMPAKVNSLDCWLLHTLFDCRNKAKKIAAALQRQK